ncbi:uncharacterized protein LOC127047246 [Gopherus flavomarginatus]|uniref:uncharacterized protein LOC127047246 n=1 Tax=Gopherus flavomarginatus TaxID=286002 RepID=UPI0021CC3834|nr:uncharacterized protein LOC127047246 [Gopherus flavomarginatus]XP_050801309.1 uncharacterized protein LOC127047246 [Gopherus flavomarginatus]
MLLWEPSISPYPSLTFKLLALILIALRVRLSASWNSKLDYTLLHGANTAASAWTIYKTQEHEGHLGQLDQATGFISGAQMTEEKAGIGALHTISALSIVTQDRLKQMVHQVATSGKALQWDQACLEVQDYLNTILFSLRKDLEQQRWPTALTNTSGIPLDLWPWRHTWKFSKWKCWCSQCSFRAYGPVKGFWAPTFHILPGPWGGCLWDWVIHRDVWEIKTPGGPNRFLIGAPAITPDLWIGLGDLWTYWPLQPPQLQCFRKLHPGEVVTVHHRVCWEGPGNLQDLASHILLSANSSCVHVNSSIIHDVAFNLHTSSGTHNIYWPAEKDYQVYLEFQVPFNWTSVVPDRFHSLFSLLPDIQSISQFQTQIHYLKTVYQKAVNALQTVHLVSTLCVKGDVLCQFTKSFQSPQKHSWYVWLLFAIDAVTFVCLCCWCCCNCLSHCTCPSTTSRSYTPPQLVSLNPLMESTLANEDRLHYATLNASLKKPPMPTFQT